MLTFGEDETLNRFAGANEELPYLQEQLQQMAMPPEQT